jgi:hypothetical protein
MIPARTRVSSFGVDMGPLERMDRPVIVGADIAGSTFDVNSPIQAVSPR